MTTHDTQPAVVPSPDRLTRLLLTCAAVGAPLFVTVFLILGAVRPGYSALRDTVSTLALGRDGWTQIADFLTCGVFMLAFAVGLNRALRPGVSAVVAAVLAGLYGLGLIASGVFVTDPDDATVHSWHGTLHNAAGTVVFLALPALCFTVAVWFARRARRRLWAVYSAATGVVMLALIQGLGVDGYGGLYQRLTIAAGWAWLTALALHLHRQRTA